MCRKKEKKVMFKIYDKITGMICEFIGEYKDFIDCVDCIVYRHNQEESKFATRKYFKTEIDGNVAIINYQ